MTPSEAREYVSEIAREARRAAALLAATTGDQRNAALLACADALEAARDELVAANAKDLARSEEFGLSAAMVKRLTLDDKRIDAMADALRDIAAPGRSRRQDRGRLQPPQRPADRETPRADRRDRHRLREPPQRHRPTRPGCASRAATRASSAAARRRSTPTSPSRPPSARASPPPACPSAAVTVIDDPDRAIVPALCTAAGLVDLIIPRGGKGLIRRRHRGRHHPRHQALRRHLPRLRPRRRRPGHGRANRRQRQVPVPRRVQRDGDAAGRRRPSPRRSCRGRPRRCARRGVELRGCDRSRAVVADMKPATEDDWSAEYLDLILAVKVVDGLDAAIEHINTLRQPSTPTRSSRGASRPPSGSSTAVDSSSVMVNASTRFSRRRRVRPGRRDRHLAPTSSTPAARWAPKT